MNKTNIFKLIALIGYLTIVIIGIFWSLLVFLTNLPLIEDIIVLQSIGSLFVFFSLLNLIFIISFSKSKKIIEKEGDRNE